MGLSRQEYWSGLSFPPPGDLLNPGIEPVSLLSPILAGGFFTTSATCMDFHVLETFLYLPPPPGECSKQSPVVINYAAKFPTFGKIPGRNG